MTDQEEACNPIQIGHVDRAQAMAQSDRNARPNGRPDPLQSIPAPMEAMVQAGAAS